MSLIDCRAKLPISMLWGVLGLGGAEKVQVLVPGGHEAKIRSPFREDNNPSFSVWMDNEGHGFWKDHGAGESGDEVTAIERVKGVGTTEAIQVYHELASVPWHQGGDDQGGKPAVKKPVKLEVVKAEKPSAAAKFLGIGNGEKKARKKTPGGGGGGGRLGEIVKVYDYVDDKGELAHQTLRFEPKAFRQRRPLRRDDDLAKVKVVRDDEGREWVWSLKNAPVFPYRLPQLKRWSLCEPVFLCEGEKDVENMERIGELMSTTLPMGAGKWRPEFARHFRHRWVIVVVDDDEAGREGAAKVADELLKVADRVGVLQLSDLWKDAPEGADLSDWIEWGWEIGMVIEEQRERLWKAIEKVDLPLDGLYDELTIKTSRGVAVLEDKMARAVVRKENLMFCGDGFWQWKKSLGKWEKWREKSRIHRTVRRVLAGQDSGELVVTNARVNSVVGLARSERVHFPEQLNGYPEGMLPVKNGLLDVDSGRLVPHRAGHLTTVQTPHRYEAGAECPQWLAWLEDRQEDQETRDQIQEMFGYCLFPHINYHSFFFLYGEGGTGKSTCVDVLEWLIGEENRVSLELTELDNPFLRSRLVGKSLYLAKELTTKSFKHIGLIKAIVAGDPIDVDVKYGEGFNFRPKGRLVMESNVMAMTPDSSGGFERRFIQIGFDKEIDRSKMEYGFQDRFLEEMPGILNWAIEGYKRLKERGRFEHTERSQEATDNLLKHRAQVKSFLKAGWIMTEKEAKGEGGEVWLDQLYLLYVDWCESVDVVEAFKDWKTFARELFNKRPEWKMLKKRRWRDGSRNYQLDGLRVMQKTEEQESDERIAADTE